MSVAEKSKSSRLPKQPAQNASDEPDLQTENKDLPKRISLLEKQLQTQNSDLKQYDALLATLPSILIGLDHENRITLWNEVAAEKFGVTREHAIGLKLKHVLIQWDVAKIEECIAHCRQTLQPVRMPELSFGDPFGESGMLGLSILPKVPEPGQPVSEVYIFGADITQRVKLERQYLHAQKMDALGRLAGGIAHDFNNLLMVILGHCELTRLSGEKIDDWKTRIREIEACAHRAASLTQQLLSFSRKQTPQERELDLNHMVDETLNMLRRLIGEHIELIYRPSEKIPLIRADAGKIAQVLMNLVLNARDAMPNGGQLQISTAETRVAQGQSPCMQPLTPGNYVVLQVSDTGCGLNEELKHRIFEPFFTTKLPGKGTGLGLATVQAIILQSGGGVRVESSAGKGALFAIYLPALPTRSRKSKPTELVESEGSGKECVMVMEDEVSIRELLREMLSASGYTVIAPETSGEALEILDVRPVDLLLTDLVMPEMDGVTLASRALAYRPALQTIFMSGYSPQELPQQHPNLPPDSFYLCKPFSRKELMSKVRSALDAIKARKQRG